MSGGPACGGSTRVPQEVQKLMQRNEYVLKNMFGSFFLATVLTALMAQLGTIADSIVMSHLVSPDALSAVLAPVLHEWCQLHLSELQSRIAIIDAQCLSL